MKKIRNSDPRDGWYSLGPSDAQRLFDEQPQNRPLKKSKVERFAEFIDEGKWLPNGESIVLDENNKLLNGQGRCRAVVIAGKPIETYIVHGVSRKYFSTFDTGQIRGAADTLALKGVNNYAIAAAVCRMAIAYEKGYTTAENHSTPNWEVDNYFKKNQTKLIEALDFLLPHFSSSPLAPTMLVFVFMETYQINQSKAKDFALGLATGQGLEANSPILALRNRLIPLRGKAYKMQRAEKLAITIKAWNAYFANKPLALLRWGRGGSERGKGEAFPSIATDE